MHLKTIYLLPVLLLITTATLASTAREAADYSANMDAGATLWESLIIPIFMILTGIGMMTIWALDIAGGKFKEQGHFFHWRNEGGDRLWLHIVAEYLTAAALIAGGIGLTGGWPWGLNVSLVALGALAYTSINSLSWVFAQKGRLSYGMPIMVSLAGSIISLFVIFSL